MRFIDRTGHLFTLKSYDTKPVGSEFTVPEFTFWIDGYSDNRKLSIDNWYVRPLYILLNNNEYIDSIEIESDKFWICTREVIDKYIHNTKENFNISNAFNISESDINGNDFMHNGVYELNKMNYDFNDVIYNNVNGIEVKCCTLYCFGYSDTEGTFTTNITLHTNYDEYTPIFVSGEWHDECEELIINGKNMGIDLPKEVLKAVYDTAFFNESPDEVLYARKLKEALLEYVNIKSKCGNYESALDSLEWFGYGNKIDFVKLMRTDNQFIESYIRDSFDIDNDMLYSFSSFNNSPYVSLSIKENDENGKVKWQDWDAEFKGEGKPIIEDLFSKVVPVVYDEGDINFWKPFYDWNFTELALKLNWLSQVWKKYFLPIHLKVMSASINRRVFANDIKHITKTNQNLTAAPIKNWNTENRILFSSEKYIYIYNQKHYIDDQFNEIEGYENLGNTTDAEILYIDDICASIPLTFINTSDSKEEFYDVNMILTRDGHKVFENKFQFLQTKDTKYKSLILSPNYIVNNVKENEQYKKYGLSYWIDKKYRLSILCNGKWYYFDFILKVPEFTLGIGTLKYNYFTTYNTIENENKESFDEWLIRNNYKREDIDEDSILNKELIDLWDSETNSSTEMSSMFTQIEKITDDSIDFNSFMYVPSLVEVNDICFYDKLENAMSLSNSSSAYITSYREYLIYLASKCYIYDFGLENNRKIWSVGNSVIPLFKFNNGIALGNISNEFKLQKFFVDIYFDIDTDNTCYAKLTYTLDELNELLKESKVIRVRHLKSYAAISDAVLVSLKDRLGLSSKGPTYIYEEGKQYIDWDSTSLEWRQFYIDDYEKNRRQITVRVVWRGTVTGPNNTSYNFGGYTSKGNPKEGYFKEIRLDVNPNATSEWCEMDCKSFCKRLCKFRKENADKLNVDKDISYDYDSEMNDKANESNKITSIISEVTTNNLESMLTQSSMQIKIANNTSYLNRIHIYDIYIGKSKWKYDSKFDIQQMNDGSFTMPQELIAIYRKFFTDTGKQKVWLRDENEYYGYDFYLMHDDKYWFGVFISQMTISNASSDDDLDCPDIIKFNEFKLKKYRSGDKFLINRMMYEDAAPTYRFNTNDLIITTIDNVNFPYILDKNTKWNIKPYSLGMPSVDDIQSTTNSAIFSIPKKVNTNISGYYDIEVRYSIDSNVNHQQIKKRRILIK